MNIFITLVVQHIGLSRKEVAENTAHRKSSFVMARRRPILLLEFLIALLIIGAILEMLFVGYRRATVNLEKTRIEKEALLKNERLSLRLGLLFRQAESCTPASMGGFIVKYQASVDPNPDFRGPLEGLLYIDKKRLILASWPEDGDPRIEVLHENISQISFLFFDAKTGTFAPRFPEIKPFMMQAIISTPNLTLPIFL